MTQSKNEVFSEIEKAFGLVPSWVRMMPDPMVVGYWGLMRDFYMAETAIPLKYKELIGLGVSGATRCKYCALFHTEGARMAGATDAEIAEAASMAGLSMMGSTFLNAMNIDYDRFKGETMQIIEHAKKQMAG